MGQIATQIGKEARAVGLTMTYAPNVDLSRDPRWGRVEENYGEDPYLTGQMGVAYVKGLQSQGVALVGPNADNPQLGGYTVREAIAHTVTLRQTLQERLGQERIIFAHYLPPQRRSHSLFL